jgi:predicted small secreted protein
MKLTLIMKTFTFLFLILTFVSCKQDNQISYRNMNATLKSDYVYNKGSYWVYQDQTMNTDSIVLLDYETGFTSLRPDKSFDRNEFIILQFINVNQSVTFNHYLSSDYIKYNGGGNWGQNGQPIFILDRIEGYEFNGLVAGESLDSLIVLGNKFYGVKKMSVIADMQYQGEFDYNMDFYFCPSIGIIKFIVYDTLNGINTWELKNFKIE